MEQTAMQVIPWQGILNNPNSAWAVVFIVLLIFVMYQNGKREERMQNTIDTTIKDHGAIISKQTDTLTGINSSLLTMKDAICEVKNRVEDIEHVIFKEEKPKC